MRREKRRNGRGVRELRMKLNQYRTLVQLNLRAGFTFEKYPRIHGSVSLKVDVNNLRWDYLKNCIQEEERYRQIACERNRESEKAEKNLRKVYRVFDKEAKAREKRKSKIVRAEDERANSELAQEYLLFDMQAFEEEMTRAGHCIAYAGF